MPNISRCSQKTIEKTFSFYRFLQDTAAVDDRFGDVLRQQDLIRAEIAIWTTRLQLRHESLPLFFLNFVKVMKILFFQNKMKPHPF